MRQGPLFRRRFFEHRQVIPGTVLRHRTRYIAREMNINPAPAIGHQGICGDLEIPQGLKPNHFGGSLRHD
jgi:hypothetical protein